jgi:LmbE family N-acetylglucosaminyl deacetylase
LKFARLGARLTLVLCTSGEAADLSKPKAEADQRVAEFRAVAAALNADAVFLGLTRYFSFSLDNILKIVPLIRSARPDIVFAPSLIEEHPEHVLASQIAREACRISRRSKFPSLGAPWKVGEFREYELDTAFTTFDTLEDISEAMPAKRELFRLYDSQMKNKDYVAAFMGLNRYRGLTKRAGDYAEAFRTTRVL